MFGSYSIAVAFVEFDFDGVCYFSIQRPKIPDVWFKWPWLFVESVIAILTFYYAT